MDSEAKVSGLAKKKKNFPGSFQFLESMTPQRQVCRSAESAGAGSDQETRALTLWLSSRSFWTVNPEEAIVVQEGQPTAEIAAEVRTRDTSAPPGFPHSK
jgi:hypothetical protein